MFVFEQDIHKLRDIRSLVFAILLFVHDYDLWVFLSSLLYLSNDFLLCYVLILCFDKTFTLDFIEWSQGPNIVSKPKPREGFMLLVSSSYSAKF